MNKEETKREIQKLYKEWPHRKAIENESTKGLMFYGWLKTTEDPILGYGKFGSGNPYQTVNSWIEEWERMWGEAERAQESRNDESEE